MSVIPISTDFVKPSQSAFFMLYVLLMGTAAFILNGMGLFCVLGITSKTRVSHTDVQY